MATRKLFRFAAAAALLALITACGGGGGSGSTADPAPPVTAQSTKVIMLTSVKLTPSPSGTGSLVDLTATGTNGADGSANLTAIASWTVSMTGLPDYAESSKLSVTTAGRLQVATSATKKVDVVVPPGITSLIKAVAAIKDSSASVEKNVTGACTAGITPFGATCKFVGQTAMSTNLSTSFMEFWQVVGGKVMQKFTFDGGTLPVMKACFSSSAVYSTVTCTLLDGKSSVTYGLTVDGKATEVDKIYHAAEPEYAKAAVQVGTVCDVNARTSYLLTAGVCASNDKVRTFVWTLQYGAGVNIEVGSLVSAADFN